MFCSDAQTLDTAVCDRDAESLEHIVVSMFDFHLDYQQAPQLRGVRDEYVSMAKGGLATKQVSLLSVLGQWLITRSTPLPNSYVPSSLLDIRCPARPR
jgi:hypothetical protein